jgi:hypothetical protein
MSVIQASDRRSAPPLVAAFAAYLDRVLADEKLGSVVVVDENDDDVPSDAAIALVLGERGRFWQRKVKRHTGLSTQFSAPVPMTRDVFGPTIPLTVLDRWDLGAVRRTPETYDVLAVITTFNEEEIIGGLIDRLVSAGVRVHIVDNWSSDSTVEIISTKLSPRVTMERFPVDHPPAYFELEKLLDRVQQIAHVSGADWVIHHDADEIRETPWPGVSLRDGLFAVDRWGFNCIDHTIVNFRPVDDSWTPGADLASWSPWFEFGDSPAHFIQLKAWKPQTEMVEIASTGGHIASFAGRRVFPYKFVTRHYPIRSQAHGERKILQERQARWSPEERARGWHTHYDHYDETTSFIWNPADLFDWRRVDDRLLLQRLSGATLPGNPEPKER